MLRTPEPKEQARLLVKLLKEEGISLQHQKSLHLIAQLAGYRNWNTMQAACSDSAKDTTAVSTSDTLEALLTAAEEVCDSADGTGCSDDLTVASSEAVERLSDLVTAIRNGNPVKPSSFTNIKAHGFSVADVQSVRPDLSEEEAAQVLHAVNKNYDASVGVSWTTLEIQADLLYRPYCVEGTINGVTCTVNLAKGTVYQETAQEIRVYGWSKRKRLALGGMFKVLHEGKPVLSAPIDASEGLYDGDEVSLQEVSQSLRELESRLGKLRVQFPA